MNVLNTPENNSTRRRPFQVWGDGGEMIPLGRAVAADGRADLELIAPADPERPFHLAVTLPDAISINLTAAVPARMPP